VTIAAVLCVKLFTLVVVLCELYAVRVPGVPALHQE
jgi:hypothetical protein